MTDNAADEWITLDELLDRLTRGRNDLTGLNAYFAFTDDIWRSRRGFRHDVTTRWAHDRYL